MLVRGIVINVHELGATVRLDDGSFAAVVASELAANRPAYVRSLQHRDALELSLEPRGRHPVVALAPEQPEPRAGVRLVDPAFEDRIAAYLKATEEWAPPDRPPPAERHFIRKKRRAAYFEARSKAT